MKAQDYNISSEKFKFRSTETVLHDTKLETKPVSYFRDALSRFTKNKASIVAAFIIAFLLLFALIGPLFTPYSVSYADKTYAFVLPKSELCRKLGITIWDGCKNVEVNDQTLGMYKAIEEELSTSDNKYEVIVGEAKKFNSTNLAGTSKVMYKITLDTYNVVGVESKLLSKEEYLALQKYQDNTGIQVIYPSTNPNLRPEAQQDNNEANFWYQTELKNGKTVIVYDESGNLIPIYQTYQLDENNNYIKDDDYNSLRIERDGGSYAYAIKVQGGYEVRVNYKEYYSYYHSQVLKDGITKPSFILGTNDQGKDIFTCLASGARFSFILAIIVATVNLFVGAIYGAIEGYYGGRVDLVMERFCDILGSVPFMIVITLLKYHLNVSHLVVLFISFFLTGWMGMAGRTRMQFYRFKNQEYVLVARTLGARDRRIMFKHIFPNAIGTLITSCVLVIPSVIFSETSLSYLGIIDLETSSMTSIGTLLAKGQNYLLTYPHLIIFPAIFISLLMLCFNLFGNGLRDAFNPSLRGMEE